MIFFPLSKISGKNQTVAALFLIGSKVARTLCLIKSKNVGESLNIMVCNTCFILINRAQSTYEILCQKFC